MNPPIGFDMVAKIERGERELTHGYMISISKALGCSPNDLIRDLKGTALPEPETALVDVFKAVFALLIDKNITNETEILSILTDQQKAYESLGQKGSLEVVRLLQESVVGRAVLTDIQKIQRTLQRARGQSDSS